MTRKSLAKPKLTDVERHNRFVAMAQQVKGFGRCEGFREGIPESIQERIRKDRPPERCDKESNIVDDPTRRVWALFSIVTPFRYQRPFLI
jgi:hypothetical protein